MTAYEETTGVSNDNGLVATKDVVLGVVRMRQSETIRSCRENELVGNEKQRENVIVGLATVVSSV